MIAFLRVCKEERVSGAKTEENKLDGLFLKENPTSIFT